MKSLHSQLSKYQRIERALFNRFRNDRYKNRILIQFNQSDDSGVFENGPSQDLTELQSEMATNLAQRGIVPVWLWVNGNASNSAVSPMIKFAYRLDCQTYIYSNGKDVSEEKAVEWMNAGASTVSIGLGGLSNQLHRSSIGNDVSEATSAIIHLNQAKRKVCSDTDIELLVPWHSSIVSELNAILDWAGEQSIDAISFVKSTFCAQSVARPGTLKSIGANLSFLRAVTHQIGKNAGFKLDMQTWLQSLSAGDKVVYRYRKNFR